MRRNWMQTVRSAWASMTCAAVLYLTVSGCENPTPVSPVVTAERSRPAAAAAAARNETAVRKELTPRQAQPAPKVAEVVPPPRQSAAPAKVRGALKAAAPPAMPPVLLSEQHRQACKVFVGDTLPPIELPDASGKQRKLMDQLGKKLTLICFFEGNLPTEQQMLLDLTPEVADRFGKQDVAVVGVAVGQKPDEVAGQLKKFGVTFPILVDSERRAYDQVAADYLPRLFLVDADGKILWLDLEYSATTRRQISDAIRHVLEAK